jgi:hypothetical protein
MGGEDSEEVLTMGKGGHWIRWHESNRYNLRLERAVHGCTGYVGGRASSFAAAYKWTEVDSMGHEAWRGGRKVDCSCDHQA